MAADDFLPLPDLRAVVDTSVLIALLWGHGDICVRLLELWENRRFVLVTSPQMIGELRGVLERPKMRAHVDAAEAQALLASLELDAVVVSGELTLPGATRDPKDDKVLACALEGEAHLVVTLDPDMLTMAMFRGVRIISPVQFVREFDI
jgi:putative PIN family toxin of toxin-antitoxin system